MVAFDYEQELDLYGKKFCKEEIFYRDMSGEWSWWGYWGWRLFIDVVFLCIAIGNGIFFLTFFSISALYFGIAPRNSRLCLNSRYLCFYGGEKDSGSDMKKSFCLEQNEIEKVLILPHLGLVGVYKKDGYGSFLFGRMRDIGRIEEFIALLKEYGYPIKIIDKEEE